MTTTAPLKGAVVVYCCQNSFKMIHLEGNNNQTSDEQSKMSNKKAVKYSKTTSKACEYFCRVIVAFSLAMIVTTHQAHAWNTGKINWMSYKSGMQAAQKTGKPIIMVFEAKWCKICKTYKKVFYNKQVVKLSKQVVMIRVNIERNRKLQQQHSVDGGYIPRTMAFSPQGYHYDDINGSNPEYKYFLHHKRAGDLIRMMKRALARSNY